jgi:F-type H+-transporting ATPase subunit epsilon
MTMKVEFVSPEDILYSGEATQVVARTRGGGDIAFLTGHEPFIGSLEICEVRVYEDAETIKRFAVRGGFVSVTGSEVTVLSDGAVQAAAVDVAAARAELEEAEVAFNANPEDPYARDNRKWAQIRLSAAGATE